MEGGLAKRRKEKNHGKRKKLLTGIGLLMEGLILAEVANLASTSGLPVWT
jgi:hypothetical protein